MHSKQGEISSHNQFLPAYEYEGLYFTHFWVVMHENVVQKVRLLDGFSH